MKHRTATVFLFALTMIAMGAGHAKADPDGDRAYKDVSWAWGDSGPCTKLTLCLSYFSDWEIKVNLGSGSISVMPRVQRITTSAHECIQNAKNALAAGDRVLAVSWVVATQLQNRPEMEWLATHGQAVITALDQI